ncbi:MAG: GNAT family N-acetyltransferase [Armatimonadetes bacterium]|nr:GNAT family N-acetyltransferase [Armatimonadota bacterium]
MIEYSFDAAAIAADQLDGGFFEGWPNPPSAADHLRILRGSFAVVLALDSGTGKVVGFITAISDGVSCAFIPYLEVLVPYRGADIGSTLVRLMVDRLRSLYMIDLVCDENVQPFYQRLGFRAMSAMSVRNYDRQSCN